MEQMIYYTGQEMFKKPAVVLHKEDIDGYNCFIISRVSHPCAYIDISKHFDSINKLDIDCHGGITYTGKMIPNIAEAPEGFYIGWDYAHLYDFCGLGNLLDEFELKKYTTEEIYEDVLDVVRQLKKIKGENDD